MDLEGIMLCEISQRAINTVGFHSQVIHRKNKDITQEINVWTRRPINSYWKGRGKRLGKVKQMGQWYGDEQRSP